MSERLHVPIRTCVGCGESGPKSTLIRIIRDQDGRLFVDSARDSGGRGGYLHPHRRCWTLFSRRKGAIRSLRAAVDRSVRAVLVEELEASGV